MEFIMLIASLMQVWAATMLAFDAAECWKAGLQKEAMFEWLVVLAVLHGGLQSLPWTA